MRHLEDYLCKYSAVSGEKTAVVSDGESVTYSRLYTLSLARASLLEKREERYILLRASRTIDFLISYLAAHLSGKAAVPLESGIPSNRFAMTGSLVGKGAVGDDVADILFSTGTTGNAKGVMITHSAIIANAENLIGAQGYTSEHAFIITGPLNHMGSLSKVWSVMMTGGTVILTDGMKDIEAFFRALDYPGSKIASFLMPASLRMLMLFSKERLKSYASKIDFIETGGAPMPQTDMDTLCSILPASRLYNTYASTETGIIATHDYQNDDRIAGCVGLPMRHSGVIIEKNGIIACKGATLMKGYVGEEDQTAGVLSDGVLRTSDIGHFDRKGRLRLDGRADDMINTGGYKISPIEIENAAMTYEGIADCVCVGVSHPLLGNAPKLIYTVKDGVSVSRRALIAYLKQNLERYKIPLLYELTDTIRRTYNGKPDRKYYAK